MESDKPDDANIFDGLTKEGKQWVLVNTRYVFCISKYNIFIIDFFRISKYNIHLYRFFIGEFHIDPLLLSECPFPDVRPTDDKHVSTIFQRICRNPKATVAKIQVNIPG